MIFGIPGMVKDHQLGFVLINKTIAPYLAQHDHLRSIKNSILGTGQSDNQNFPLFAINTTPVIIITVAITI